MAYAPNASPLRLAGHRIGILVEADYVEPEIQYYQARFAEEGATVHLLTRLWGQDSLTFLGHEYRAPLQVDTDLSRFAGVRVRELSALVVPGGFVADRLRYDDVPGNHPPAVQLLQDAFNESSVLKAFACHGLMLMAALPGPLHDRRVTCHNNLVGDIRNMGARYEDADVVHDSDLVSVRTAAHAPLLTRRVIDLLSDPLQPAAGTQSPVATYRPPTLAHALRTNSRPDWLIPSGSPR